MPKTMEKTESADKENKSGFMQWLTEDDAPEIGIAAKEPLDEYLNGVQSEVKKIEWPGKEQVGYEFFAVVVIVAIIAAMIYVIDLGLDKVINFITGS